MHIVASDLKVRLGGRFVLDGVSFSIGSGRWIGLIGPNGSGKTTLLRTVAGLLPYSGSLCLGDREVRVWDAREMARTLAFVRQSASVAFAFNVSEYVLLGRVPYAGILTDYSAEDRALLQGILDETDLRGLESRSILELSGGELQRVVLAQALLQDPDVLLLDEPTTHLDVEHQYRLLTVVRHRVQAGDLTVLSSFHDLELASRFSDELLVLSDGAVAGSGAAESVVTPTLLADVFRMQAAVATDADGTLQIDYKHISTAHAET